jgi:hypothetical protein
MIHNLNSMQLGAEPQRFPTLQLSSLVVVAIHLDYLICHVKLPRAARTSASFGGTLGLDRRTWRRAIGTEHATVALLRPQLGATACALVENPASVRGHHLRFRSAERQIATRMRIR